MSAFQINRIALSNNNYLIFRHYSLKKLLKRFFLALYLILDSFLLFFLKITY